MPDTPPVFGRRGPAKRQGGSTAIRDTSAAYRRLRRLLLAQEPLCRYCRARGHISPATVLDHILALSLGGTNDQANLAPSCQPCNDAKAKVEQRLARKGWIGRDAMLDPELADWLRLACLEL